MMYVHIFLLVIILKIDLCILWFFILLQKLKINEAKEEKRGFLSLTSYSKPYEHENNEKDGL